MRVILFCEDGVFQSYHINPDNLERMQKKYGERMILKSELPVICVMIAISKPIMDILQ